MVPPWKIYPHPNQPLHLWRWLIWEKSGKSSFVNVLLDWCKSNSNWGTNIIVVQGDELDVKDKGVGQEWLSFWLEQQVDGSDINSDGESQEKRS